MSILRRKENGTRVMPQNLRIPFRNNSIHYVHYDQKTFEMWAMREITTTEAIKRISWNQKVVVSVPQFLANAEWLGYFRREL